MNQAEVTQILDAAKLVVPEEEWKDGGPCLAAFLTGLGIDPAKVRAGGFTLAHMGADHWHFTHTRIISTVELHAALENAKRVRAERDR